MLSNAVCNHIRDKQVKLRLSGRPILLSLILLQTQLDSTQSYYNYKSYYVKVLHDLRCQSGIILSGYHINN